MAYSAPHLRTASSKKNRNLPLALTLFHLFNCLRLIGFPQSFQVQTLKVEYVTI